MSRRKLIFGSYQDVQSFLPSDIAGLSWWIDANDISTVNAGNPFNGEVVYQVLDKSGNNHTATQGTGTNQPKWTSSGFGTQNKAHFFLNGLNHLLANTLGGLLNGEDKPYTIFAPVEVANLSTTRSIVCWNKIGNVFEQVQPRIIAAGNFSHVKRSADQQVAAINNGSIATINTAYLYGFIDSGTTGNIYIDGSLDVTGSTDVGVLSSDLFTFGARKPNGSPTSTTNRWWGKIAEIVIYNRAINATERANLESYFNSKYGIY